MSFILRIIRNVHFFLMEFPEERDALGCLCMSDVVVRTLFGGPSRKGNNRIIPCGPPEFG